jgi:hypothetical protein
MGIGQCRVEPTYWLGFCYCGWMNWVGWFWGNTVLQGVGMRLLKFWSIIDAFRMRTFFLHSIDAVGLYTATHGFDREWEFWCIIDAPVMHWECGLFYNYTALMARIMPVLTMCAGWCRSANAGVAGSQSCTFNQHVVLSCSWFGEQMLELGDSWESRFQYEHVVLSFWIHMHEWVYCIGYILYTVYEIVI